eukprot:CAMPEP_0177535002 /NCGR_PEP_ID=MMETSP0369-20130122/56301_1 /TAXON_ID=447022 ORGANISM="Scrippsiella hangoei-like, Strain SHHI-4" /NCGR_SAMPLE_ID=MMETSP0369 /ASSEMBLY_ACC=CAM_ASM_000364 /LENGTH=73 /DNA_ID=CAMNT_0019017097 /DNA_START=55 /DNA_END=276 /DNA_ORIENTATION=+
MSAGAQPWEGTKTDNVALVSTQRKGCPQQQTPSKNHLLRSGRRRLPRAPQRRRFKTKCREQGRGRSESIVVAP